MSTRVTIERIGSGTRGDRYRVLHDGLVIVASSRDPEHDTCRALLEMGITGKLETWHAGAAYPSMRLDIERGAGRTVIENERSGPRLGRWRPFDPTQRLGKAIADSTSVQGREFEGQPVPT